MGVNEFCSIQEMQRQLEEERQQRILEALTRLRWPNIHTSEDLDFLACELGVSQQWRK